MKKKKHTRKKPLVENKKNKKKETKSTLIDNIVNE